MIKLRKMFILVLKEYPVLGEILSAPNQLETILQGWVTILQHVGLLLM